MNGCEGRSGQRRTGLSPEAVEETKVRMFPWKDSYASVPYITGGEERQRRENRSAKGVKRGKQFRCERGSQIEEDKTRCTGGADRFDLIKRLEGGETR